MYNITLNLVTRSAGWKKYNITKTKLKRIIQCVLHKCLVDEGAATEVSVLLTSDKEICRYNAEYRNKDTATNVLSFPLMSQPIASKEPYLCLGDVILALETIEREAIDEGKSFDDHFMHLFVHGMLHLLGFTHDKTADTSKMQKVEIDVLGDLGIKSPYGSNLK